MLSKTLMTTLIREMVYPGITATPSRGGSTASSFCDGASLTCAQSEVRTQTTSGLWLEFVAKKRAVEPGVTPQASPQTNLDTLNGSAAMQVLGACSR